ncbi:MAG TPA: Zn-ribbon domain-containing OB-fold protein [Candidatus Thermoplasmatota archaeon]|nr:Zn-ribbon domain-containing OB-fold protein [Candidatus Thermoplasmatota archaeon]
MPPTYTAASFGAARRAWGADSTSTRTSAHDTAAAGKPEAKLPPANPVPEPLPYLLDFYPQEDAAFTQISPFFDALKEGRFVTSYCKNCDKLHFPPRIACDACTIEELEWREISKKGRIYAFTAMMLGAPMGMEQDVPFPIAVVEVEGTPFKILARIDDARFEDLKIGQAVELKVHRLADGRVFYRYRLPTA